MSAHQSTTRLADRRCMLVVDDEPANRQIAKLTIEKMGFQVTCAGSMAEALTHITQQSYAAALIDLSLAERSGDELAQHIHRQLGPATPPLLAWTATITPEIEARCLLAGMCYVLGKPLNRSLLRAALVRFAGMTEGGPETAAIHHRHKPQHPASEPLDLSKIDVLDDSLIEQHRQQASDGQELLPRLLAILKTDGQQQVRACQLALTNEQPLALLKACHRLAGCAAAVGASRLAHYCRSLEHALRQEHLPDDKALGRMEELLHEAVSALQQAVLRQPPPPETSTVDEPLSSAGRTRTALITDLTHVLLVEDSEAERLLFSTHLYQSQPALKLSQATSLHQALNILGDSTPTVIVLDLSLPDSEGLDTFLAIHRRAPMVPIVILSGSDNESLILNLIQQGAEDFLVKNAVREGQLWRSVQLAIARHRQDEQRAMRLTDDSPLLPVTAAKRAAKSNTSGLNIALHDDLSLGSGGMADVFLADQIGLNRQVAVKVLRRNSGNPRAIAMFQTEARILAQLEHPHIVPVYDMGESFIVMQRIRGQTLADSIRDDPQRLRTTEHVAVLADICDAVSYAHSKGIIHRDIKPENIMFGPHRATFLLDWGLALTIDPPATGEPIAPLMPENHAQLCAGTPAYLPPEIANADPQSIGYATDVFLLAGTLYAILSHRPLYANMATKDILTVASCGFFRPLDELMPKAPPMLRHLVAAATSLCPDDRPTLSLFAATLRAWLGQQSTS